MNRNEWHEKKKKKTERKETRCVEVFRRQEGGWIENNKIPLAVAGKQTEGRIFSQQFCWHRIIKRKNEFR